MDISSNICKFIIRFESQKDKSFLPFSQINQFKKDFAKSEREISSKNSPVNMASFGKFPYYLNI